MLKRLDHAAIFVLIAGSFTPIHVIRFRGLWRLEMLTGIWALAVAGLTVTILYFATMPEWLGLLMYLGLVWLGVISTVALARRFGVRFILPLMWGRSRIPSELWRIFCTGRGSSRTASARTRYFTSPFWRAFPSTGPSFAALPAAAPRRLYTPRYRCCTSSLADSATESPLQTTRPFSSM